MTNEQKQLNDIDTLLKQRNRWALKYQELEAVLDERIAAAVAAEREECAQLARGHHGGEVFKSGSEQYNKACLQIEAAIRARGEGGKE